jgi:pimeloyl-ACP methyl ester carboxylesterase
VPTLVLLHGAWHDSWCWGLLRAELESLGVEAVAMDLPVTEPAAGIERYVDVVCTAIDELDDVILVAHSLAGLVAPVVASRRDIRGLVMLTALWPAPGQSAREQARSLPATYTEAYRGAPMIRRDDRATEVPRDVALDLLYQDCDPELALEACAHLHPQHWRAWAEACPLAHWPGVPTIGMGCTADRMLGAEGIRRGAERAGAPLTWLDSGHSPMLSMPLELARLLTSAAGDVM